MKPRRRERESGGEWRKVRLEGERRKRTHYLFNSRLRDEETAEDPRGRR